MNDRVKYASVAPTITAGAYSAGDVVGGLLTFELRPAPVAGVTPCSGFLRIVSVVDDDNEKAACKLHIFRDQPSSIADNAAFAPTVGDLQKRIGVVEIAAADYTTLNSNAQALVSGIEMEFDSVNGNLYAYLVADATPTYTAVTDLTVAITCYLT